MMDTKYTLTRNNKIIPMILMAIGLVAILLGFTTEHDSTRIWASLLHNNFYFMGLDVAGTLFVELQYVAQAGWAIGLVRVPEAMGGYLKYAMPIMLIIFAFGHEHLYHWTHAELYVKTLENGTPNPEYDKILDGKSGFLNIPFFIVRLLAYTAIWVGFWYMIRKNSMQEDLNGGLGYYRKNITLGAIFLVLFAVTSSTSAWDFLMSLDAHWFSTLFGWYIFIGMFVTGMTTICLFTLYLKMRGYMQHVNENHLQDVGKFMFAFSIFWTYLWFSQFMLIWYANLPEEVVYYKVRWEMFKPLWAANLIINFCLPILILMTRDAKRKTKVLWVAGIIILCGHWLDIWLMVSPGTLGSHAHISFIEIGTMCFFLGLFLWSTLRELSQAALVPKNHPMLPESLHHHI